MKARSKALYVTDQYEPLRVRRKAGAYGLGTECENTKELQRPLNERG